MRKDRNEDIPQNNGSNHSEHNDLYHLVYVAGGTILLGVVDFIFLYPEDHLLSFLILSLWLSLVAIYELHSRGLRTHIAPAIGAIFCAPLAIFGVVGPKPPPPPLVGWLQPANDPTPDNGCGTSVEPGSVLLIVGGSGFVLSPRFSHVNAVTLGSCNTITMTLGDNGLSLSSDLYDTSGSSIGTLVDNKYTIDANAKIIAQPSSYLSTLVIHSDDGK